MCCSRRRRPEEENPYRVGPVDRIPPAPRDVGPHNASCGEPGIPLILLHNDSPGGPSLVAHKFHGFLSSPFRALYRILRKAAAARLFAPPRPDRPIADAGGTREIKMQDLGGRCVHLSGGLGWIAHGRLPRGTHPPARDLPRFAP